MSPEEIKELLDSFKIGTSMEVPMTTTLWPDTHPWYNTLTRNSETSFTLVTTFSEFWAGHGFSGNQTETETMTLDRVLSSCEYHNRNEFTPSKAH